MNQTVDEAEEKNQAGLRVRQNLEQENSELREQVQSLQEQLESHEEFNQNAARAVESARDTFNKEKRDLVDKMERDKAEWCDRQLAHYTMKINSLKSLNDNLNQRLNQVKRTEEELLAVTDELAKAKQVNQTIRQDCETLSVQLKQTETHKQSLQSELKNTQHNLVDNIENERTRLDDRIIQMQMQLKIKDEKIQAQRDDMRVLEQRLQTKISEMSAQRNTIEETEEVDKKRLEGHQQEIDRKEQELQRVVRLQQEKEEELSKLTKKFEDKLAKKQKRADDQMERLNQMVADQLQEIQRLKETVAVKERTNTELEKKVLLQSSPDRSPKKQSYSGKEIDELSDQIRTKEEEIQILWNVIKEINKTKGNAINMGQL